MGLRFNQNGSCVDPAWPAADYKVRFVHHDYASKQWGGLVSGYHLPLWKRFFDRMHTAAASGPLPQQAVYTELAQLGAAWVNATNAIPGLSGEDSVAVASELLAKWDPGH